MSRHVDDPEAVAARHQQVLEMLEVQTVHVTKRAHLVQGTLLCLLSAIGCLVVCSLASGASAVISRAIVVAAGFFVAGMLCVLAAVVFAVRELRAALEPVELESRFVGDLTESAEGLG